MSGRIKTWVDYWNRPSRAAYLFIFPSLFIIFAFTVCPLVASIGMSFLKVNIFLRDVHFIGIDNFTRMFQDERLWNAMKNTFVYWIVEMPAQIVVSILLAVYLSQNTRFRRVIRSALFIPSICSLTAIGIVWSFLLDPQMGLYPYWLQQLGLPHLSFFQSPNLALPSVILISVWHNFGYTMVILVAGMQSIPKMYFEAARMDGASSVKTFFRVTLPMLAPTLSFCIVTTTISALQVFDQIYVTTQGGPMYSTESVVEYIFNTGFTMPYDLSYASAISTVLFVCIIVVSLSLNKFFMRREADVA